jgi:hypothetical protein
MKVIFTSLLVLAAFATVSEAGNRRVVTVRSGGSYGNFSARGSYGVGNFNSRGYSNDFRFRGNYGYNRQVVVNGFGGYYSPSVTVLAAPVQLQYEPPVVVEQAPVVVQKAPIILSQPYYYSYGGVRVFSRRHH